jgi:hypothetical protein
MYERKPLFSLGLDVAGLAKYVDTELQRISMAFKASTKYIALAAVHAAPDKPFDGMTVLADGTDWDPGSGQGVYTYYGAAWNKLG